VIRAALVATLILLPGLAQAKSGSAGAERKSRQHPPPERFDFEFPDLPVLPGIPDLDFSGIEIDLPDLVAKNFSRHREDPEDEDVDVDEDEDRGDEDVEINSDRGGKAKVYKVNPQRSIRLPRVHLGDDDRGFDESEATAKAKGSRGTATLEVKGPVTFQMRAQAGEVEVVASERRQATVTLTDAPPEEIALYAYGDRVEPSFRGRRTLRRGKLRVELPRGSRLDLSSMSGDVSAASIGDVRIRTMSGDVKLSGVGKADVQTISGDTRIDEASGPVRLHTVSGRALVATSGTAPQVEFQSASGSLDWTGTCSKDCHLSAETVSGEVRLTVDPRSSFELSYTSHSGELRDELNLAVKRSPRRKHGMSSGWLEASYGKGEGVIEADAFSGSVLVRKK